MLIDFHMHSNTSQDSTQTIRDIYEAAVEKGISHICITNHMEHSEIRNGDYHQSMDDEDLNRCRAEIDTLNKEGKVHISFGVEIGYLDDNEDEIRQFLDTHEFDFVMGSIHYVLGWVVISENREKMKHIPNGDMITEYFRLLKKAIGTGLFDVMGHLDIYKRGIDDPGFEELKDEWEGVADLLLKTGTGFEINTSDAKRVPGGTYPDKKIIKYLVERGVTKITVGSDAHKTEFIGYGIKEVYDFLKSLGVDKVYRFDKRKAIAEDI